MMLIICILGLAIGSFLNVCIYRMPKGQSVISPPSQCTWCGKRLKFFDLIPIVSLILLHWRCRYCGEKISLRYITVEILTGLLFILCLSKFDYGFNFAFAIIFVSFLIVISFIDYDHQLILDKILMWFSGTGLLINLFADYTDIINLIYGSLAGGGTLLLISLLTQGGMGGGDIKFMAALGLWLGLKLTLLTLFLSFVIGGIGSLLLLAFKIKSRKDFIPFGPFIAVAAFISMLYGNEIIAWYLNLL